MPFLPPNQQRQSTEGNADSYTQMHVSLGRNREKKQLNQSRCHLRHGPDGSTQGKGNFGNISHPIVNYRTYIKRVAKMINLIWLAEQRCGFLMWVVQQLVYHQSIMAPLEERTHIVTYKGKKGSPYSVNECRVSQLILVLGTRLPSVGFWSWSWFLAVSLQMTWVINLAVGYHDFLQGLQLPLPPLRGLLPILLLGEQRHGGCEQFA